MTFPPISTRGQPTRFSIERLTRVPGAPARGSIWITLGAQPAPRHARKSQAAARPAAVVWSLRIIFYFLDRRRSYTRAPAAGNRNRSFRPGLKTLKKSIFPLDSKISLGVERAEFFAIPLCGCGLE